jgi:hypothetical protein
MRSGNELGRKCSKSTQKREKIIEKTEESHEGEAIFYDYTISFK